MISIKNEALAVFCDESGRGLAILDWKRGTRWILDEKTLVFGTLSKNGYRETELHPLLPVSAESTDNHTLTVSCRAGETSVKMVYTIFNEFVEVRIPPSDNGDIGVISLPGSFLAAGESCKMVFPIMQGMLWDGRGPSFNWRLIEAGHSGFAMAMLGYVGSSGGLLVTAETRDDVLWWIGKDDADRCWACSLQVESLGSMRYERVVRLYPVDADHVAVAKKYRQRVREKGRFKSWDEKLAARPAIERLFGSLICFIGYCQDDLDYAAECRKLKDYGFDRALIFPVRFNTYRRNILMGGKPPIDLGFEQVEAIKKLGYDVAPWSWLNEAIDDGSDGIRRTYRKTADGAVIPGWQIDQQRWYVCCTSFMEKYQKNALQGEFVDMTWDHFDVITCATNNECYALDHPNHPGRPLSRSEDREWIKKLLLTGQEKGLIISSESFNDAYSMEYDIGSVKAFPQYRHFPFWPIPLTMLVYHDSMIHTWWEVHDYNNPWHGHGRTHIMYDNGGGKPRLMSALDALMGSPPLVFPFGAQYMWTGKKSETFAYRFRFEEADVQQALNAALPVARLHRKVGRLEMIDHRILSEDGNVHETTFSDGTRVVANFCSQFQEGIPGIGPLQAESWKVV